MAEINFVKEGKAATLKNKNVTRSDPKWGGKCKVEVDLGSPLIFPLVDINQRKEESNRDGANSQVGTGLALR